MGENRRKFNPKGKNKNKLADSAKHNPKQEELSQDSIKETIDGFKKIITNHENRLTFNEVRLNYFEGRLDPLNESDKKHSKAPDHTYT